MRANKIQVNQRIYVKDFIGDRRQNGRKPFFRMDYLHKSRIKPFHWEKWATMITALLSDNVAPHIVQRLADHSSLSTTMLYFNTRIISQRAAVGHLDAILPGNIDCNREKITGESVREDGGTRTKKQMSSASIIFVLMKYNITD